MSIELKTKRMAIAARHWQDAKQEVLEVHSRAAAAFDAGYIYALVLANAPALVWTTLTGASSSARVRTLLRLSSSSVDIHRMGQVTFGLN